jgi:hypothetical protein
MALLDLSLVTRSLVRLVRLAIESSPAWPGGQTVHVTSKSPDQLTETNSLGIYLFHAVEQAAHKNLTWRNRPDAPIKFSPLALDLHYVVCAKSDLAEELAPYREQLLMGLALKALHDYPIIDDGTMIGPDLVLEPALLGGENRLRIALRHVPISEAVSYWTAMGERALRFCAYYEVSVVLLEPEEPARGSGRVFSYGIDVLAGGLPRLTGSRSTVRFTLPTETTAREVDVMPAQGAIGDELTFLGAALSGGIELRVRGGTWPAARTVGAAWGVNGSDDRVFATVQADADGEPMFPGTYTGAVAVTKSGIRSDGTPYTTTRSSNQVPFVVTPAVVVGPVTATGEFSVTGGLFADPRPTPIDVLVRVAVGGIQLVEGTLPLDEGTFVVTSPTELQVRLPQGVVAAQTPQLRIEVQGAESAPAWVLP